MTAEYQLIQKERKYRECDWSTTKKIMLYFLLPLFLL